MMRTERGRWFAEPVHHVRAIRKVDITAARRRGNRAARHGETLDGGHDVDDRLGVEIGHRRAADVLDGSSEPGSEFPLQDRPFLLEA